MIHAQYGYPNGLAALEASRRTGVPNLVSIQGGDGHWVGTCCSTHRDAMRAVLGHAGAVLIGSASFAEEVSGHHGTPLDRFTIVPGATDTDRFSPRDEADLGALGDPPTLLYHGRVDVRKGVLELLDAFASLVDGGRDLRLIVSGIGPDVAAVGDRVEMARPGRPGRADRLRLVRGGPGGLSPGRHLRLADLFRGVLQHDPRGDGLGPADRLDPGRSGWSTAWRTAGTACWSSPATPRGSPSAIARLLDDAPLRRDWPRRALDEVRSLYSWPAVARTIERRLRGGRRRRRWTTPGPASTTPARRPSPPPTRRADSGPSPTCSDPAPRSRWTTPPSRPPTALFALAAPGRRRLLVRRDGRRPPPARAGGSWWRRSSRRACRPLGLRPGLPARQGPAAPTSTTWRSAGTRTRPSAGPSPRASTSCAGSACPRPPTGATARPPRSSPTSAPATPPAPRSPDVLGDVVAALAPDLVLAPQALGGHVDHRQVVGAVLGLPGLADRIAWYRDLPYAEKFPGAPADPRLPAGLIEVAIPLGPDDLAAKLDGCACYATQVPFQFGGEAEMQAAARRVRRRRGVPVRPAGHAEAFLVGRRPFAGPQRASSLAGLVAAGPA